MNNKLNAFELKQMFICVAQKVVESEKYLTVIDKKIGDGDHGTNMALGFKEVKKELESKNYDYVNDVFHDVGMLLLDTMGGASGVLFGTVFISGIVGMEKNNEIGLEDFADIFKGSLNALKKRGKAEVGDKTMVDALEPATLALDKAVNDGNTLIAGFNSAAQKAFEGKEHTKECIAKFGRAKSYGKSSLGLEDAGAVSVWIIFDSMAQWIKDNKSI